MRRSGFLLIELLYSLSIVVILGTLLVLYRIHCINIAVNTKRHFIAIDIAREALESFGEKVGKKIKIPSYINYFVEKNVDNFGGGKGIFVKSFVEWMDIKKKKHAVVFETYYRDRLS